jgi:DMSO/TMAO reductase YedYZ molybdopterin-dependent catalytic subunit
MDKAYRSLEHPSGLWYTSAMSKTSLILARREFLSGLAAAALLRGAPDGELVPFLEKTPFNPERPTLPWEQTTSWITPAEHFFRVGHYGFPKVDVASWRLQIDGLVAKPRSFTLEELKKRPRREYVAALECSGNRPAGGLVANARWTGTPLVPILKECGIKPEGIEVVFFAADKGTEKIRNADYPQNFARSLAVADALKDNVLLLYDCNGQPLTAEHGAPVRLGVPGWYGVAWVKWLDRIEAHDRKFQNRFMGRDYVTIRGEQHGDQVVWRETLVGKMNLKSVVARVTKLPSGGLHVTGAAWSDGTPIKSVEIKIDEGPWTATEFKPDRKQPFAWQFWSFDWKDPKPGEHAITCRAVDARGKAQPDPNDPSITMKKTYWESNQQAIRKIKV